MLQAWQGEYGDWSKRDLSGKRYVYLWADDAPPARAKAKGRRSRDGQTIVPSSLDNAFLLDGPGEYEVSGVLLTGVRTYRDDERGARRGKGTAFVVELDGLHTIHLGDVGHLLTEEKLGDIGSIDIVCVPIGGALTATRAAELVASFRRSARKTADARKPEPRPAATASPSVTAAGASPRKWRPAPANPNAKRANVTKRGENQPPA
jgi:hypothetical protein